ncbi:MAG TPA: hypothetical protein VGM83_06700 [Devosiaceae bacterium]|jgi:NAD(P)-dependent dehydrogenase (short-subunit alcohol dehydrogenase family)
MDRWIDLTGRRALVIGGTKGVGAAVVNALQREHDQCPLGRQ